MLLYQQITERLKDKIREGVYRPGDRLPSLREASQSLGVSLTTMYHAYNVLESHGFIRARPQSGYTVREQTHAGAEAYAPRQPLSWLPGVDMDAVATQVLSSLDGPGIVPFGAAYLDRDLLPLEQVLGYVRDVTRRPPPHAADPAGAMDLRREIAKRYLLLGYDVALEDIVVTSGVIDAVNLALSTLLRPGDRVAVADASFFAVSFSLHRFGLVPHPIPTTAQGGIDLGALAHALESGAVKACLLMTNCHNPLGFSLDSEQKAELVALLATHQVPLIDNDVYGELHFSPTHNPSAKAFDKDGWVLHCGSFSHTLAPEMRVGWIAAGRFRDRLLSVKFLSSMSVPGAVHQAIAEYLRHENFDRHLRRLRRELRARVEEGFRHIDAWGPLVQARSAPAGGFMVWLALPPQVDSLALYQQALQAGLTFVPGALFSVDRVRANEIALNFSFPWNDQNIAALGELHRLIRTAVS